MTKRWMAAARRRIPLVFAAALLGAVPAHAEDAVLVSSTVQAYVPGMVVADGETFRLPAGGSAVLLFRSGAMLRLKGPFDGRVGPPAGAVDGGATALVAELRKMGADASVIGASRGIEVAHAAMQGQRIMVEPGRSAIYCIGPGDSVWLVRPSSPSGTLRIRRAQSVREIAWSGPTTEWPSDLEIEDGDRFETLGKSGEALATIVFRRIAATRSETAWVAENMLLGCRKQAAPALREIAATVESGSK